MTDSSFPLADCPAEGAEAPTDAREAAMPEPAPKRPRYRPSEAWALRWLGPPATSGT